MTIKRPVSSDEIDLVGSLLIPGQSIGTDKLIEMAVGPGKLPHKDRFYQVKREMQIRGFITEVRRRGPNMLTFHKEPVPEADRTLPVNKSAKAEPTPCEHLTGVAERAAKLIERLQKAEQQRAEQDARIAEIRKQLATLLGVDK